MWTMRTGGKRRCILHRQGNALAFSSASMSSIHTEYDYRGKGQCVTLSVPDNTYFLFPLEEGFNATEIQFAVEEFFERSHS